jgi:hypothetical protein
MHELAPQHMADSKVKTAPHHPRNQFHWRIHCLPRGCCCGSQTSPTLERNWGCLAMCHHVSRNRF